MLCCHKSVSKVNGITTAMLRREDPLSVVLPKFMEWLTSTVEAIKQATRTLYHPGNNLLEMLKNHYYYKDRL